MASKSFLNRLKHALALEEAVETDLEKVARGLERALMEDLEEGEEMPDVALLLRLLGRRMARHRRALVKTEDAHEGEEKLDDGPRQVRDEAAAEVYAMLLRFARVLDAAYGRGKRFEYLGFKGSLRRDPASIQYQGEVTLHLLRSRELDEEERTVSLDLDALAAELEPAVERLRAARKVVGLRVREREGTQVHRARTRKAFDGTFGVVGRTLEGLYELAGEDELGKLLRPPTQPKKRRRAARARRAARRDRKKPEPPAEPIKDD